MLELVCLVTEQWQQQIFSTRAGQPGGCSRKQISQPQYVPVCTSGIMTPRTYRYVRVRTDLSDHILCSPTSLQIFGRTNISKDVPRHLLIYLYVQVHTFYQNTYSYVLVCTSTGISWYIVVHDSTKRYISIHWYTERYKHVHTSTYLFGQGTWAYIQICHILSRW